MNTSRPAGRGEDAIASVRVPRSLSTKSGAQQPPKFGGGGLWGGGLQSGAQQSPGSGGIASPFGGGGIASQFGLGNATGAQPPKFGGGGLWGIASQQPGMPSPGSRWGGIASQFGGRGIASKFGLGNATGAPLSPQQRRQAMFGGGGLRGGLWGGGIQPTTQPTPLPQMTGPAHSGSPSMLRSPGMLQQTFNAVYGRAKPPTMQRHKSATMAQLGNMRYGPNSFQKSRPLAFNNPGLQRNFLQRSFGTMLGLGDNFLGTAPKPSAKMLAGMGAAPAQAATGWRGMGQSPMLQNFTNLG